MSDQPEDGLGDGHHAPDCRLDPDAGSVLVRSERSGTILSGRHVTVRAVARDACGNASEPTAVGRILIAHDRRERLPCLRAHPPGPGAGGPRR